MHFPLLETLFLKKKIPCHRVALVKDSAIFNVSFQFGNILLRVSFTYQIPICMYNYPLIFPLFGIKIEQQSFLETSKTVCRIHIALCNVSKMLAHTPKILHHMHWPSFPLGSNYNTTADYIENLSWNLTISYLLVIFVRALLQYC